MPGLLLDMDPQEAVPPKVQEYDFVVSHQKVELEVDFATKSVVGRTEITVIPQNKELRTIRVDAHQCVIPSDRVLVNYRVATVSYEDRYRALDIPSQYAWDVGQFEMQRERLKPVAEPILANGAVIVTIPKTVRIEEVDPFSEGSTIVVAERGLGASVARNPSIAIDGIGSVSTPILTPKPGSDQSSRFAPLVVTIPFSIRSCRDGLQWVGLEEGDSRYPHVYTRHSIEPGVASCIFPCIDNPAVRCTWEIGIKCSKTLGEALQRPLVVSSYRHKKGHTNGHVNGVNGVNGMEQSEIQLSDEDKLLEMTVLCSGELTDEVVDLEDSSKKTVTFLCASLVAAQHIGFAIGPFEQIDLSEFREVEEGEKLGQGQAVQVLGFCLPGRVEELRNTCAPMAHAVDYFSLTFGKYPFQEYKLCFVDDQVTDTVHTASLSLCSTRLLFSEDFIDPEVDNTRTLVHAVASQWMGVGIVPQQRADRWAIVGISYFMTGLFMKSLCGTNEYLFRQKTLMDRLVELDINRPSLAALGEILHLGSFEYDFMALKAPLVLFILDRRIMKASGSVGLIRIISKMIVTANTSGDSVLSSLGFAKFCYKVTKYKCDAFWEQWVLGSGCPRFSITQRFNKKRLCVEMTISQKQDTIPLQRKLEQSDFLREFKEETHGVFSEGIRSVFTGPMTIRIHEADGTPYEHIVELREGVGKFEIPYNTKYKRLKRSRRQKERANAGAGIDITAENQDDVLIYCLGDVLQSRDEVLDWGLVDWDAETEMRMDQESYEWIRIDADFEWLCEINFVSMPSYMYVSQLQQDRDVVAQQDSMLFLRNANPHPLVSTILIRTLMDRRYFHGIRTMAAECLKTHASPTCNWIGLRHLEKAFQEFFCYPQSRTPQPNDFVDKRAYWVKCAIPGAMARIRNNEGRCPKDARQFILDQLRFSDNGSNEFSDYHYIANLLTALTESLIPSKKIVDEVLFGDDEDEEDREPKQFRDSVIEEIDRYRRMDEWIHSYQNIYTTTALVCKQRLMKTGVIPVDPLEFAQYVHDGTADLIRIKAFEALVDLGFLMNNSVCTLLLNVMSTDRSPHVRNRLFEVFCLGLASVASGESKEADASTAVEQDTLIVEGEGALEARKAHIARTTSIDGALAALKEELKENVALREALWAAVKSPVISLSEQYDLLDICGILYEPEESFIIKLKLPRYWRIKKLGKGILEFKQSDKLRTKLKPVYNQSKVLPAPFQATSLPLKISVKSSQASMKPPKRHSPPERNESVDGQPKRKIVKFKIGDFSKVNKIQSSPPKPAHAQSASFSKPPPVPEHSAPISSSQPSPVPKFSLSTTSTPFVAASSVQLASPIPSTATAQGTAPIKPRKPLPDSAPHPPVKKNSIIIKLKTKPTNPS